MTFSAVVEGRCSLTSVEATSSAQVRFRHSSQTWSIDQVLGLNFPC
jgi:hypothetical protein